MLSPPRRPIVAPVRFPAFGGDVLSLLWWNRFGQHVGAYVADVSDRPCFFYCSESYPLTAILEGLGPNFMIVSELQNALSGDGVSVECAKTRALVGVCMHWLSAMKQHWQTTGYHTDWLASNREDVWIDKEH